MIPPVINRWRQFRTPVILALFWFTYVYTWVVWGWRDTNTLFSAPWWFDETGHALYGVMGSVTLLHFFQNYAAKGIFRITGRFFLSLIVISIVALLGVFWELCEFIWDMWLQPEYFDWLGKAQSDSIDTSLDIIVNTLFSTFAIGIYGLYNFFYKKLYPEEIEMFQVEELIDDIRHISRKIQSRRREHLRHIVPEVKKLIRTIRQNRQKR